VGINLSLGGEEICVVRLGKSMELCHDTGNS